MYSSLIRGSFADARWPRADDSCRLLDRMSNIEWKPKDTSEEHRSPAVAPRGMHLPEGYSKDLPRLLKGPMAVNTPGLMI